MTIKVLFNLLTNLLCIVIEIFNIYFILYNPESSSTGSAFGVLPNDHLVSVPKTTYPTQNLASIMVYVASRVLCVPLGLVEVRAS